ncbi:hypothetical protein OS493_003479 [Desmophyllum pertusum]|uniref:Chromo domain-containing protein n=1 Tax=Desmophyllum pertusum TaxID=174260 RepID=A0A9X0A5I7_9CNID|nr:hypothetical protein OS493_003479 [Desmophyllum pertusum]
MASRDRPVEGFYSALNAVSSADADIMEPKNKRVNRRRTAGTYWEVERLVERRERSGAIEYLVLWKGYQAYEASWEPEDFILPRCIELYWRPRPDLSLVRENIVCFRIAVERHLKSQSRLPVRIFLRGDVFRFFIGRQGGF